MKIMFSERAWEDYLYWLEHDRKLLRRINALIREIQRTPYGGTGKPEPLRHALTGWWSRRITEEHRIVYRIRDDSVQIAQLRYKY
ncbi:MAG: Txe/YoeB family addiction module toxin [Bacteroidetes bacterium]|nr:Txe/YoeB family addiction module toxin [Bacteroidota bacterium]